MIQVSHHNTPKRKEEKSLPTTLSMMGYKWYEVDNGLLRISKSDLNKSNGWYTWVGEPIWK